MSSRRYFQAGEKAAQRAEALVAASNAGDQVAQPRQVGHRETFLTPEEVQAILRLPSVKRVYDLIHQHHRAAESRPAACRGERPVNLSWWVLYEFLKNGLALIGGVAVVAVGWMVFVGWLMDRAWRKHRHIEGGR